MLRVQLELCGGAPRCFAFRYAYVLPLWTCEAVVVSGFRILLVKYPQRFNWTGTDMNVDDNELRNSLHCDEFVLHYQPQIEIATEQLMGLRARAGWRHPEHGLIFPDNFVGRTNAPGMLSEFDRLLLCRGLSELEQFADMDGNLPRLSLRVSPDSLCNRQFPDIFESLTRNHDVPADKCVVELADDRLIIQHTLALDVLIWLRRKGFQISVNSYGIGRVGLQQRRDFCVTELMIDRRLVQNMLESERDRVLVQKTIMDAHELYMTALADGVKTERQLDYLRQNGCDYAQGPFVSDPLALERMAEWLGHRRSEAGLVAD